MKKSNKGNTKFSSSIHTLFCARYDKTFEDEFRERSSPIRDHIKLRWVGSRVSDHLASLYPIYPGTCQTSNIIYCITCSKCQQQYVGQSERTLQARFSEHRDYAKKKDYSKACGAHFSSRGHSVHDMKVSILEKVHSIDELLREERESMFIRKFNCKYKGINRQT